VAQGQVGVSAHSGADEPTRSAPVHWPLTARLSRPEAWAAAGARRAQVRVPTDVTVQTKPALALAWVEQARTWGGPCAPVVTDAGAGDQPTFLTGRDDRPVASVVGVRSTCGVRLPDAVRAAPRVPPPHPRGRGQPQKPRPAPLSAAPAVRAALPEDRWPPMTWRAPAAGVLRTQLVAVRVHWATGGAQCSPSPPRVYTGPEGWLLGARPVPGDRGEATGYGRNLAADTPLPGLVELAHSRWPMEPFYEDAKGECGLAHDQGRRWDGRSRHLALVRLAYSFLARQRWMPTDPVGFSPRRGAPSVPGGPSPRAPVALPRRRVMAYRHQSNCSLPPQADLTKYRLFHMT
jgi:SRSO17 transposase